MTAGASVQRTCSTTCVCLCRACVVCEVRARARKRFLPRVDYQTHLLASPLNSGEVCAHEGSTDLWSKRATVGGATASGGGEGLSQSFTCST